MTPALWTSVLPTRIKWQTICGSFFQKWFAAHTKYANLPFFIAAESYGGHYAPALAYHIQQQNRAGAGKKINLSGVLIGDGLVDPINQYPSYPKFVKAHQK